MPDKTTSRIANSLRHTAPPLSAPSLPVAISSAELLHGTLRRLGPGIVPAHWPDTSLTRAAALRDYLRSNLIPCGMTAAWIWQTAPPPTLSHPQPSQQATSTSRQMHFPLTFCTAGSLTQKVPSWYSLHRFKLAPQDVIKLGTISVTSPARTLADILRSRIELTRTVIVTCRLLSQRVLNEHYSQTGQDTGEEQAKFSCSSAETTAKGGAKTFAHPIQKLNDTAPSSAQQPLRELLLRETQRCNRNTRAHFTARAKTVWGTANWW